MTQRSGAAEGSWVRVWDPFVRLFHWSLVLSFGVAWLSANEWEDLHMWAGYAASALILLRVAWGFIGTPYARFSSFIRSPTTVIDYLKAVVTGSAARHVGHNPAGGAMIVALMLAMAATAFTGWLLTTDAFWGDRWAQHVHNYLADGLLLLVCVHLAGVFLASYRHRENLIAAMVLGRKRMAEAEDID